MSEEPNNEMPEQEPADQTEEGAEATPTPEA